MSLVFLFGSGPLADFLSIGDDSRGSILAQAIAGTVSTFTGNLILFDYWPWRRVFMCPFYVSSDSRKWAGTASAFSHGHEL